MRLIVSRQIGHLLNNFAQFKQEAICPHSINAQLASASKQILQASSQEPAGFAEDSEGIDRLGDSITNETI